MGGVAVIIGCAGQVSRLVRSQRAMTALNRGLAGVLALGGG